MIIDNLLQSIIDVSFPNYIKLMLFGQATIAQILGGSAIKKAKQPE